MNLEQPQSDNISEESVVSFPSEKEAEHLDEKMVIIDKVLKEMGFSEGCAKYSEYMQEMATKDFEKYMEFLKRVDELGKK